MKKISAVLAAILIYSSAFAIDTAAYTTEENINGVIVVDDINSASKISRLSISGKKATCKSTYVSSGNLGVTDVRLVSQYKGALIVDVLSPNSPLGL